MELLLQGYWYAILFVFGTVVGSFLNVVIYRLHTGKSLGGNSHCMSCGKRLSWYELFPLFSYLIQGARCRGCKAYIPSRYFWVELTTGLVYAYLWKLTGSQAFEYVLYAVLASILIVVAVYDLRHTIIPDELSILTLVIVLVYVAFTVSSSGEYQLILAHLLAGLGAAIFFASLWYVSKGRWMGLGDAKLAFPLGLMVGYPGVYSMIVFSFWIGAILSISLLILQYIKKRGKISLAFTSVPITIKSEVPFAPFLILGFFCVQLLHANIFDITFSLFSL